MTRRTGDWLLIVVLMGSWGVLFARGIEDGLRTQRGILPIAVSAASAAEPYPRVKSGRDQPPGLLPGDELTALDGESLRGVSALGFYDRATRAAREKGFADVSAMRGSSVFAVRLSLRPNSSWWIGSLTSVGILLSGLFLLACAPGWHLARRHFVASWCFAVARAAYEPTGVSTTFFEASLNFSGWAVGAVLTVWNAQEFTISARPVPKLQRGFALAVGLLFAVTYLVRYYLPVHTVAVSDLLLFGAASSLAAATIAGLSRAYSRSEPLERRQIRWVALGFGVAFVGVSLAAAAGPLATAAGRPLSPGEQLAARLLSSVPTLAIPIGITISVVGYRWLDIDRVISAAASYTIVGLAVLGVAVALAPRLASAAAPALGLEPGVAQWLFTMALVLAAVPAHLYLRPQLDRRLFAERHQRMSGLELLVDEVGRCAGADELWKLTSERIDTLLGPDFLVAYAREGQTFTPRFARGRAEPSPYDADSLLVRALERRGLPLAADSSALDPFDRAALETLGVALVLPIGTHESLLGFACLGSKRSGDIYTREETAQLAAVALRCAQVLRPQPEPSPALPHVFRREGDLWTIASNGKEIRVRDMRGLHYLAALLREPGREFAVTDLVSAASGLAPVAGVRDPDLQIARGTGDAGPVLDGQARAAYRARLSELDLELADAERCADLGRSERASEEREILLAELESAGRGKRAASDSERARVAVTKAIKVALEKISERHPELGAHLATHVRRGYACAYDPDPRDAMAWEV